MRWSTKIWQFWLVSWEDEACKRYHAPSPWACKSQLIQAGYLDKPRLACSSSKRGSFKTLHAGPKSQQGQIWQKWMQQSNCCGPLHQSIAFTLTSFSWTSSNSNLICHKCPFWFERDCNSWCAVSFVSSIWRLAHWSSAFFDATFSCFSVNRQQHYRLTCREWIQ